MSNELMHLVSDSGLTHLFHARLWLSQSFSLYVCFSQSFSLYVCLV